MAIPEDIALLRGQPVPETSLKFGENLEADGQGGRLNVLDGVGVDVGTAGGLTADEVIAEAQKLGDD